MGRRRLDGVDARAADQLVRARAAEQETNWRAGYLTHFRRLVEAGLASPDAARAVAGAGLDAVRAGSAKRVLVVTGETRMAAPRTALEANIGDGAAALLLGADDVIATLESAHAVSDEIIDVWRTEGDPFVHTWEDRFVVDHGYRDNVVEVVRGLLAKAHIAPKDVAKAVLFGPDARSHATVAKKLGFEIAGITSSIVAW